MAAATTDRGIPLSTLSTKFLHTNSTSHTGPFSAIAELIDNAYDPDVNAEQIWIDKTQINDTECLTFMDDGNGLSRDLMQKMLSFGFSNKVALNGKHPIGMYGNGFKSGSMRLGEDAIVLSKSMNGQWCVGMLSQTYLEKMGGTQVAVPIISINTQEATNEMWKNRASLWDILEHSPFNTEEELLTELQAMESTTGTKIIIWNLRRTSERKTELNFTAENDIRIPCDDLDTSVPESYYSLRAYCSILYLKPSMQITIQGQKVEAHPISESLEHISTSSYKPQVVKQKIPIIFGYNTKSKEHYGLMMYYNNRLIKAYHRVGCQLKAKNRTSIGVIGVIECNYLKPTHNKQDFEYTSIYKNTLQSVAKKLRDYGWKRKKNPSDNVPIEGTNDKTTDNNDELQETSGEGTSGTKRPRRNGDEGESERPMNLRSSTAATRENMEISRERELLVRNLTQENQELLAQIDELHLMVEQLEGKKASTCQECEQNKARVTELTEFKRRIAGRVQQLNYECNVVEETLEQVLHSDGPTSQQHH